MTFVLPLKYRRKSLSASDGPPSPLFAFSNWSASPSSSPITASSPLPNTPFSSTSPPPIEYPRLHRCRSFGSDGKGDGEMELAAWSLKSRPRSETFSGYYSRVEYSTPKPDLDFCVGSLDLSEKEETEDGLSLEYEFPPQGTYFHTSAERGRWKSDPRSLYSRPHSTQTSHCRQNEPNENFMDTVGQGAPSLPDALQSSHHLASHYPVSPAKPTLPPILSRTSSPPPPSTEGLVYALESVTGSMANDFSLGASLSPSSPKGPETTMPRNVSSCKSIPECNRDVPAPPSIKSPPCSSRMLEDTECASPTSSPCFMGEFPASFSPECHSTCQTMANLGNLVDVNERTVSSPSLPISTKNELQMDVDTVPESTIDDASPLADPCDGGVVDVVDEPCLEREPAAGINGEPPEESAKEEAVKMEDSPSPVAADTDEPAFGCDRDQRDSHSDQTSSDTIPPPPAGVEQDTAPGSATSNQKKRNEEKQKDEDRKEIEEPSRKKARLSLVPLSPQLSNGANSAESHTKETEGSVKPAKSRKRLSMTVELKKVTTQKPLADRCDGPLPSPTRRSSECCHPETSLPTMTQSHIEMHGLLIETFATSRASSLPISGLYKAVMQSRPILQNQKSAEEWRTIIREVLERGCSPVGSGVFAKVDCNGMDENRRVEVQWFYVPEKDEDQDRAMLIKSMMPRPAKRAETKKYKQYYWKPLGKISRWDPEDTL